ncbi:MAG: putative RNA methyltransferase [Fusobacteriaceae bacterium]
MIICPICKKDLKREEKRYICEDNHSFDISKQGHANLLLSNQKNSKNPGDNREMVQSRKNFLEKENYSGISDRVNEILKNNLVEERAIDILDIGCGEGYYTGRLKKYLDSHGIKNSITAIDISKEAVIAGAKSYKGINWIVGSATSLPIKDESLDFIICMFAKIDPIEFKRTLKKGGKLLIVSTGENHLEEMKEVVYESVKKDFYLPVEDESLKIFNHKSSVTHNYVTEIKGKETIQNLFNMTPYRWRSPREGIERLFNLESLKTKIEVTIDIFEK